MLPRLARLRERRRRRAHEPGIIAAQRLSPSTSRADGMRAVAPLRTTRPITIVVTANARYRMRMRDDSTMRAGTKRRDGDDPGTTADRSTPEPAGLDDPRAVQILTTEHWSLLSFRNLGYQEMFGRATIFIGIVSATLVALALIAQATRFGRETLIVAALLMPVALFIGLATFVRSVAINAEDARWLEGMRRLHRGYLEIVPGLDRFLVAPPGTVADPRGLAHGGRQNPRTLARSLTTTSSVIAALDSVLAGALASDLVALAGIRLATIAIVGAVVSLISAVVHVRYAARFRRRHAPAA